MTQVQFKEWTCEVRKHRYDNGRVALQLVDVGDGGQVARATVNLPNEPLGEGECFVKDWSENETMLDVLEEAGVVKPTGRVAVTGHVVAKHCKVLI